MDCNGFLGIIYPDYYNFIFTICTLNSSITDWNRHTSLWLAHSLGVSKWTLKMLIFWDCKILGQVIKICSFELYIYAHIQWTLIYPFSLKLIRVLVRCRGYIFPNSNYGGRTRDWICIELTQFLLIKYSSLIWKGCTIHVSRVRLGFEIQCHI